MTRKIEDENRSIPSGKFNAFGNHLDHHQLLKRHLYSRCKQLNARVAIVGTKRSADFLLETIGSSDIEVVGVYEHENIQTHPTLHGHSVRPIHELSKLKPEDVVLIASSNEATDLYDTFMLIQSLCPCKTLNLNALVDTFMIYEELRSPLKFQFDHYLFGRGLFPLPGENPNWHLPPPDIDFKDKVILELGPFEGHLSVMLMAQKPKKVIGLEARPLNYAKISVARSLYNWQNYELLLGDMHLFPQLVKNKIDIIFCSGVFYHSEKPWWLLKSCMDRCDTIILCGHVASEFSKKPRQTQKVILESGTYQFEIYPEYGWRDELSGVTSNSLWFTEEDLIRFLNYYGFQYKKYGSTVLDPGLWIFSVVTKK